MRHFMLVVALVVGWVVAGGQAARGDELIAETEAARYGLTRPWFAQAQVDPARGKVQTVILDSGVLFVQTDQALIQAFDADSGTPLWATEVGARDLLTTTPGVNQRLLAVVNGLDLCLLNRHDGKILWRTKLEAAPSAGPAVSQQRVWVPLANGLVVAYRFKPVKRDPTSLDLIKPEALTAEQRAARDKERRESYRLEQGPPEVARCHSPGRATVRPLVTFESSAEEFVAWSTEKGYLCMARVSRTMGTGIELRYRLQTEAPIVCEPAYLPPDPAVTGDSGVIYAASQDGFVHAIQEKTGKHLWRFPTGSPVAESPVVVGAFVLVANQFGGMFCLDAMTGDQVWWTPEVTQFIAASRQRVYAADTLGRLHVLSAPTGSPLAVLPTESLPLKVANAESDRVFMAGKTGTLLCLHEVELSQKVIRHQAADEPEEVFDAKLLPKAAGEEKPAEQPAAKRKSVV